MEAIYEFDVVDMPVTVAVDAGGFQRPKETQVPLGMPRSARSRDRGLIRQAPSPQHKAQVFRTSRGFLFCHTSLHLGQQAPRSRYCPRRQPPELTS